MTSPTSGVKIRNRAGFFTLSIFQIRHWTCSLTRLVIEQALQNTPHFAVFSGCCSETEVSEQLHFTRFFPFRVFGTIEPCAKPGGHGNYVFLKKLQETLI
jgi:hypothetical protein